MYLPASIRTFTPQHVASTQQGYMYISRSLPARVRSMLRHAMANYQVVVPLAPCRPLTRTLACILPGFRSRNTPRAMIGSTVVTFSPHPHHGITLANEHVHWGNL